MLNPGLIAKEATVADFTPQLAALEQKRELTRTLQGGTTAMRNAGEKYLPQHPAESEGVYKTRLAKTFLDNFVGKTIEKATGKIFCRAVAIKDIPAEIEAINENVDRMGSDIGSFLMDVCKQAFQDGISYVLADKPYVEGVQTVAEEKASGSRPYAIHIKPSALLEATGAIIDGTEKLARVRIMEMITEESGEWGQVQIPQVRVLDRGANGVSWRTFRKNDKEEWKEHQSGTTALKEIYLIPFYANRTGYMMGEPGFQDIAESTLEHWQWKSEHAHALSMCCFGMYTATGVEDNYQLHVGPGKAHTSTNPETKFDVLETSGVGVTLATDTLKAIETRIESAGVNLRVENGGKVTATAAAIDSADTHAGLAAVAEGFGDSTEALMCALAQMMGVDCNCEAEFNTDFGASKGTPQGLVGLSKLRATRDISREGILKEFQRRGELDEEFDIEADAVLIKKEPKPVDTTTMVLE